MACKLLNKKVLMNKKKKFKIRISHVIIILNKLTNYLVLLH